MTTKEVIIHIERIAAEAEAARQWHEARSMVIRHLEVYHGLTDHFQWAVKTIEIFQEYEKLKANEL